MKSILIAPVATLLFSFALFGCEPIIAPYSVEAYRNDTSLKVDVAALVDLSASAHADHVADINAVTLKLNEAREFAKDEAYNRLSTAEWDLLLAQDGHLYFAFLKSWNSHGSLNDAERSGWKTIFDRAFDDMICLETNKQTATQCPPIEALPAGH